MRTKKTGGKERIVRVVAAAMAMCVFAVGCGHDPVRQATSSPLEIEVSVEDMGSQVKSAVNGMSFADSNAINVFVKGESYDSLITRYSKLSGNWTASSTGIIMLNTGMAEVYASYPAEEISDSSGKMKSVTPSVEGLSIPVSIRNPQTFDGADQSDYMYALSGEMNRVPYKLAVVNSGSNKASLVFIHGLSELTFNLKATGYAGHKVYLTEIRLVKNVGDFKWGEGRMSLKASPESRFESLKSSSELYFDGIRELSGETTAVSGLVVPAGADGISLEMYLVIDGEPKTVYGNLPSGTGSGSIGKWNPGTDYEYGIELRSGALLFENLTINPWRQVEVGNITVE